MRGRWSRMTAGAALASLTVSLLAIACSRERAGFDTADASPKTADAEYVPESYVPPGRAVPSTCACDAASVVTLRVDDAGDVLLRHAEPYWGCWSDGPSLESACGSDFLSACGGREGGPPCVFVGAGKGDYFDDDRVLWFLNDASLVFDAGDGGTASGSFRASASRADGGSAAGTVEISGVFDVCAGASYRPCAGP